MDIKYFSVINGREGSGIYYGKWDEVRKLTEGRSNAKAKSYKKFEIVQKEFYEKTERLVNEYSIWKDGKWVTYEHEQQATPSKTEPLIRRAIKVSFSSPEKPDQKQEKWVSYGKMAKIHEAAANGDINQISELIREGEDVNKLTEDNDAETPLHCAVKFNQIEAIKFLIENKADLTIRKKGGQGRSAVDLAAEFHDPVTRKNITDLFPSIKSGYFNVEFDGDIIKKIDCFSRYDNVSLGVNTEANGQGENMQKCHIKSAYSLRKMMETLCMGKSYIDVMNFCVNILDKNNKKPYMVFYDRLGFMSALLDYYKFISENENIFYDIPSRNGAFGYLSKIVSDYDKEGKSVIVWKKVSTICHEHYEHLSILEDINQYIYKKNGKYELHADSNNIDIIRQLADKHYEVKSGNYDQSNKYKLQTIENCTASSSSSSSFDSVSQAADGMKEISPLSSCSFFKRKIDTCSIVSEEQEEKNEPNVKKLKM